MERGAASPGRGPAGRQRARPLATRARRRRGGRGAAGQPPAQQSHHCLPRSAQDERTAYRQEAT